MKFFFRLYGAIIQKIVAFNSFCQRAYDNTKFQYIGKNVYIGKECIFSFENISIGDCTYIGNKCVVQSAHGQINIGKHVMFGAGVHVHGGNHNYHVIGKYMDEVSKQKGADGLLDIKDDVWIGSCAIILGAAKEIGEGAIVAAGAVVTKRVEPYTIVAGNPAKVIKTRFTPEQIQKHKRIIDDRENAKV